MIQFDGKVSVDSLILLGTAAIFLYQTAQMRREAKAADRQAALAKEQEVRASQAAAKQEELATRAVVSQAAAAEISAAAQKSGVYYQMLLNTLTVDSYFVTYPNLRPFFYDNEEVSTDHPDYNRAISLAELILDFLEFVVDDSAFLGDEDDREAWSAYAQEMVASSPLIRQTMAGKPSWYCNVEALLGAREEKSDLGIRPTTALPT